MLLCSDNPASRIIFNSLQAGFGQVSVVQEEPVAQMALLRRRADRLGVAKVAGQVLFRALVVPWLTLRGRNRVAEIKRQLELDDGPMANVEHVSSMNDTSARELLASMHPVITVVCGTRILTRDTLAALNGPVVNFHAGITPLYRGVHGGYWALVDGRRDLVGSTIHRIDPGIDTGEVIAQATFEVTKADSFVTYPYLHVAAALGPLADVVGRARYGDDLMSQPLRRDLGSKLRTHPTLWEYRRYARRGVR